MAPSSLQDGIDNAGSPIELLWKDSFQGWKPPVLPDEFVDWRVEQAAAYETVALADLSHHMRDLFIEGADATRLLSELSANDYDNFAVDQAKQFVPVTAEGLMIQDGILLREAQHRYVLSGPPPAHSWVLFHGNKGGYAVELVEDPSSEFRNGNPPVLFRYQVQGPRALDLVERVFGGPLPKTRFFHSTLVSLDGRSFRALRHVMAGQPGYEFVGAWKDAEYVKESLLRAGDEFGLIQVGAFAYSTSGVESGWIPTPTPAIYTAPELREYREWLPLFSFEGQRGIHGTYFSADIEDYYVSPYDLGYGRSISLSHDFIGRDALEQRRDDVRLKQVTLEFDPSDAVTVAGDRFWDDKGRYRIETVEGKGVGMTYHASMVGRLGTALALSLIEVAHSSPGTPVIVVFGLHPGPGNDPDGDYGFDRVRATVQPAPYDAFARTTYRAD